MNTEDLDGYTSWGVPEKGAIEVISFYENDIVHLLTKKVVRAGALKG